MPLNVPRRVSVVVVVGEREKDFPRILRHPARVACQLSMHARTETIGLHPPTHCIHSIRNIFTVSRRASIKKMTLEKSLYLFCPPISFSRVLLVCGIGKIVVGRLNQQIDIVYHRLLLLLLQREKL